METVRISQINKLVSRIGLGTVKFGRNTGVKYPQGFDLPDEKTLAGVIETARDCGINLIDTAPAYGVSEERLGRLLLGRIDEWVVMSKAGEEFESGISRHDFSPAYIEYSLMRTLKRLKTDCLDILMLHSDGRDTEILGDDDLIDTLQGFKTRGLVRMVGASTKTVHGGLMALDRLDTAMIAYSHDYTDERRVLDEAQAMQKPVFLKKILASGHIKIPPAQAVKFSLSHPAATAAVIGSLNPAHITELAAAV